MKLDSEEIKARIEEGIDAEDDYRNEALWIIAYHLAVFNERAEQSLARKP